MCVVFLARGDGGASLTPLFPKESSDMKEATIDGSARGRRTLVGGVEGPPRSDDGDIFIVTPMGASSLETFIGWTDMWTA